MKYTVTSSQASKLLKKLLEEKELLLADERQSCVFNASLGEDVESVRPAYDYAQTRSALLALNEKIRLVKHAINRFNVSQTVGETGMMVDQVLVAIPQLTQRRAVLYEMQSRLPKQRANVGGIGSNTVIDYRYTNYSVEEVKADYARVSDELRALQTALDLVNTTVTMELELPD